MADKKEETEQTFFFPQEGRVHKVQPIFEVILRLCKADSKMTPEKPGVMDWDGTGNFDYDRTIETVDDQIRNRAWEETQALVNALAQSGPQTEARWRKLIEMMIRPFFGSLRTVFASKADPVRAKEEGELKAKVDEILGILALQPVQKNMVPPPTPPSWDLI